MKKLSYVALAVAAISLVIGIISRVTVIPIPVAASGGIEAHAFLAFANTCLLGAIAFILMDKN